MEFICKVNELLKNRDLVDGAKLNQYLLPIGLMWPQSLPSSAVQQNQGKYYCSGNLFKFNKRQIIRAAFGEHAILRIVDNLRGKFIYNTSLLITVMHASSAFLSNIPNVLYIHNIPITHLCVRFPNDLNFSWKISKNLLEFNATLQP